MTNYTQTTNGAEFMISEANGNRSRAAGTVAAAQNLKAGQVVQLSAGKLVAKDGTLDTGGALVTEAEGILLYDVNATTTGPNGAVDTPASYIKRDAEVNSNLLTYPATGTDLATNAQINTSLALLGIIVR